MSCIYLCPGFIFFVYVYECLNVFVFVSLFGLLLILSAMLVFLSSINVSKLITW